jgi:hypothetical protein
VPGQIQLQQGPGGGLKAEMPLQVVRVGVGGAGNM